MVIGYTISHRLASTLGVIAVFMTFGYIFLRTIPITVVWVILLVLGLVGVLITLHALFPSRILIDKPAQTLTISKRSFFLTSRQRVIPFSDVRSVRIDYKQKTSPRSYGSTYSVGGTSQDAWEVSLDIGDENFKIDHTTKRADMLELASEIRRFVGKEPPEPTREELISWYKARGKQGHWNR